MLRLLTDEDVHGDIIRGLLRQEPALDLLRVQDVGPSNTPDPDILEWAAAEGRILITEDVNTLVGHAWARVRAGQPMPGVLVRSASADIGTAIQEILIAACCGTEDDMKDQVRFIPI
jgi:predicted nuclease of predicted toxin-antitoxin system